MQSSSGVRGNPMVPVPTPVSTTPLTLEMMICNEGDHSRCGGFPIGIICVSE
jgi:hypothetical protein